MNQHVNFAAQIQIIGCQFDSNKVFLPWLFAEILHNTSESLKNVAKNKAINESQMQF